jgi:hypothetical protein
VFQAQQETIRIIVDRVVQGHDILQGMHVRTLQTNDRVRETELLHYGRRGGSIVFLEIRPAFTTESSRYKRPVTHFRYPLDVQVGGLGEYVGALSNSGTSSVDLVQLLVTKWRVGSEIPRIVLRRLYQTYSTTCSDSRYEPKP